MTVRKLLLVLPLMLLLSGCINNTKPTNTIAVDGRSVISKALLAHYENWKGTPYLLGGDTIEGIDCSAFTKLTYSELFRIHLPRTTAGQAYYGESIQQVSLQSGDLVLFQTYGEKQRHVGIYVEDGVFLHASTSAGVTLSKLSNPYWKEHYWKAIRPSDMATVQQQR